MMTRAATIAGSLALALFLGLLAWGLVYAGRAETESEPDRAEQFGNAVILDVRDPASYKAGHIPGAINIPLNELGYRLFSLDKTKDIIVYCFTGVTSQVACQILVNAGFKDVYNVIGGIKVWNYAIETSDGRVNI